MDGFFKKVYDDLKKTRNIPVLLITIVLATLKPLNELFEVFKKLPLPVTLGGIYLALVICLLYILRRKDRYSAKERMISMIVLICLSIAIATYGIFYATAAYKEYRQKTIAEDNRRKEILAHKKKINILTAYFTRDTLQDSFSSQLLIELNDKIRGEKDVIMERAPSYYDDVSNVESRIVQAFSDANSTRGILAYGNYTPLDKRLACKVYIHNLVDSIAVADSTNPGKFFTIKIPQKYDIDFGQQVTMAADFIVALLYQRIGKNDQSLAILRKLYADTSITTSLKYATLQTSGDNALATNDYSKAISFYNEAKQINPKNEGLAYKSAVAYYANKEYLAADVVATDLTAGKPEFSDLKSKAKSMASNTEAKKNGIVAQDGKMVLKLNDTVLSDFSAGDVKEYSLDGKRYFVIKGKNGNKVVDEKGTVSHDLPKDLRKVTLSAPPPVRY